MRKRITKPDVELDRLTVRIPEDLKARFEEKTAEMDLSMGQVARKLIEDWLNSNPQHKPFSFQI